VRGSEEMEDRKKRYIYKITNLVNGKIYIGQTNNLKNRWSGHICDAKKNPRWPIDFAFRKYGRDNFKYETLEIHYTVNNTNDAEIYLIAAFDARNKKIGYNIRKGGDMWEHTPQQRQQMSIDKMGEKNPFFGKTHTEETRKFFSDRLVGNTYRRGKPSPQKTKDLISKATAGEKNPNSKLTAEQVAEIRRLYKPRDKKYSSPKLAKLFGVALITIARILNNKAWR
jgi:group I intron endonuclease